MSQWSLGPAWSANSQLICLSKSSLNYRTGIIVGSLRQLIFEKNSRFFYFCRIQIFGLVDMKACLKARPVRGPGLQKAGILAVSCRPLPSRGALSEFSNRLLRNRRVAGGTARTLQSSLAGRFNLGPSGAGSRRKLGLNRRTAAPIRLFGSLRCGRRASHSGPSGLGGSDNSRPSSRA